MTASSLQPKNYLAYWKPGTAQHNIEAGRFLDYAGSNQYERVEVNDVVWLVSCFKGSLYLLGRIKVDSVIDRSVATAMFTDAKLWQARYFILAAPGTSHRIRRLSIDHIAANLRLRSPTGRDRLDLVDGHTQAQQLQRMRVLEEQSVTLLEDALGKVSEEVSNQQSLETVRSRSNRSEKKSEKARTTGKASVSVPRQSLNRTLRRLQAAGLKSDDLLKLEYRDSDRSEAPLSGLCYVLSECMYHLYPGIFTPYRISWGDGTTHWFLRLFNGDIFDSIQEFGEECCEPEDYESARRVGFLSKEPSKRSRTLLKRSGLTLPG